MGSRYYGEPNYTGNEKSGGGSSRKGNKQKAGSNNNSEKAPKQPQRGLGVAQLEKIRLNSQLAATQAQPPPNYHYPSHLLNQAEIGTAYSSIPTSSASYPYASSAPSYGFPGHQNLAMGLGQLEGANVRYSDSQPSSTAPRFLSQYPNSGALETPYFAQPSMTRHYQAEDSFQRKRKKDRFDSTGSSSQNTNTSDSELDLELKLSL